MTMRPRSFDPEAATEAALSDLLRRFDALIDPAAGTTTAATAAVIFTGPIEPTYLVAASTARDEIKAVADYVCDGTDDQAEINAAWLAVESLNIAGGRVVLSAGTFNITDGVVVNPDQTEPGVMVGAGRGGTLLSMVSGSDTSAVRVRAGSTVRDFSILVTGTTTITRGALEIDETDSAAFNISIDTDDGVGIWCDGPRSRVESCDVITRTDATHGIFVHADANGSKIINNYVIESRQHGIMIDGDAGGTGDHTQISGNTIRRPSQQTVDSFDGIHMEGPFLADHGPTIVGNIIFNDGGNDFRDGILVAAANVVDVTITGNTVGVGVGRWAINMDGVRSIASGNRLMGGIDVGGDDNHIVGNLVAIINDDSNGIVVGGDRNSIMDNKIFPQSGSDPTVGIEIESGATDNVVGFNDLEQTGTQLTDAGTNTVVLATGADHGGLAGLGDDDHLQYLLTTGGRTLTGDIDMGGNFITRVNALSSTDTELIFRATSSGASGQVIRMQVDDSVGTLRNRLLLIGTNGDVEFYKDDGATLALQWDESENRWEFTTPVVIDQLSTTEAAPVLTLDQADVDEDFFRFIGTSDTNVDRALVDAANFTTPGAIVGWLKINVQDDQGTAPIVDGDYYVPFYAAPTA